VTSLDMTLSRTACGKLQYSV